MSYEVLMHRAPYSSPNGGRKQTTSADIKNIAFNQESKQAGGGIYVSFDIFDPNYPKLGVNGIAFQIGDASYDDCSRLIRPRFNEAYARAKSTSSRPMPSLTEAEKNAIASKIGVAYRKWAGISHSDSDEDVLEHGAPMAFFEGLIWQQQYTKNGITYKGAGLSFMTKKQSEAVASGNPSITESIGPYIYEVDKIPSKAQLSAEMVKEIAANCFNRGVVISPKESKKAIDAFYSYLIQKNKSSERRAVKHSAEQEDDDDVIDCTEESEDILEHREINTYQTPHPGFAGYSVNHEGYYSPNLTPTIDFRYQGCQLEEQQRTNPVVWFQFLSNKENFKPDGSGGVMTNCTLNFVSDPRMTKSNSLIKQMIAGKVKQWSDSRKIKYTLHETELNKCASAVHRLLMQYKQTHPEFVDHLNTSGNRKPSLSNVFGHSAYTVVPAGESELYHHGILGMKWGVRRYQNADGSLTDLGKKHYGLGNPKYQRKKGIAETETVMKRLNSFRNGADVYIDKEKFRNSSGDETAFKTGEAHAKATEHYAKFLSDSYKMFDSMIPKRMTGDTREKYISHLLNQTVAELNANPVGFVEKGVKIKYGIDTSRGLNDIDFRVDFEYPDERKIK